MTFRKVLLLSAALAVGVLIASGAGYMAANWLRPETRAALTAEGISEANLFMYEPFYKGQDSGAKEYGNARSDHAALALAISHCYPGFGNPLNWSSTTRAMLLFELDEHAMHTIRISASKDDASKASPVLNAFHEAAISFSDRISRDRLAYRRELEEKRSLAWWYQLLIVALGAVATIFVTLRSMLKQDNKAAFSVGVIAIMLSASQAAVSSMSGFDSSQATALRDQRALSQLQQLHWRVITDVLNKPELCKHPEGDPSTAMAMAGAWRSRLEAVLDNAVESISRPGDTSSGQAAPDPQLPPAASVKTAATAEASTVRK